jgi:hypothetical protein
MLKFNIPYRPYWLLIQWSVYIIFALLATIVALVTNKRLKTIYIIITLSSLAIVSIFIFLVLLSLYLDPAT